MALAEISELVQLVALGLGEAFKLWQQLSEILNRAQSAGSAVVLPTDQAALDALLEQARTSLIVAIAKRKLEEDAAKKTTPT